MLFKPANILGLLFIVIACNNQLLPLTEAEKEMSQTLSYKYGCKISLQHDHAAIADNKTNGEFYVTFDDNGTAVCKKDSTELKKMATDITLQILQVLSHRANYHSFHIVFSTIRATGPDSNRTICQKELDVNIDSPYQVSISSYYEK